MAEYIDREEVVTLLRHCTATKWQGKLPDGRVCHYSDVVDAVCVLPAADVEPVRRGKWNLCGDSWCVWYQCSECGASAADWEPKPYNPRGVPPYCHSCGAKMDCDRGNCMACAHKGSDDYCIDCKWNGCIVVGIADDCWEPKGVQDGTEN